MKPDDIFDAIGEVNDEAVADAKKTDKKANRLRPWLKWSGIAASFVLVCGIGILAAIIFMGGNAGGGAEEGLTYMSYAGPVFPLTLKDEADITADRGIDLDFADYREGEYGNHITVTDAYTLKNPTAEDITVTALYPYAGVSTASPPSLSVDGKAVTSTVRYGGYNPSRMTSFADYERLIKGGGYPDTVYRDFPSLDGIPAVVYRLHDYSVYKDEKVTNPTLQMSFYIDAEKTYVYSYNMNSGKYNDKTGFVARATSDTTVEGNSHPSDAFVIIVGEDIKDYKITGYRNAGCDKGDEVDDLACTVTRYESTLGDVIEYFLADFAEEGYLVSGDIDTSKALVSEFLYSTGALAMSGADQSFGNLENAFSIARNSSRVMYAEFDVTVPAGGSVSVIATMEKEASMDFVGKNTDRHGYAVATSLGSMLRYGQQTASLSNTSDIEIVNQNFGFDLNAGITKVTLSESVDHYFIDVKQKSSK